MPTSESTLSTILSAAEKLFVAKNYADVSMRDIAAASNVSTGALYHHFPGKEKLYYAMLTAYMARVKQASLDATPVHGTCRERLRALTLVYLTMPPTRRSVMRLVRRDLSVFNGKLRQGIIRAYQNAVPDLVEQVLTDAIKNREIAKQDARWLAWAYVAIIETTLADYAQSHLGSVDARLDSALTLFFDGVAVNGAARKRGHNAR